MFRRTQGNWIFSIFFNITLLLDVKTSLKCEKIVIRSFQYCLLFNFKTFYRTMHVVQSAVLLLLLFLVAPFWNTELKRKPFNWHPPIQCRKMKISKMSAIYLKYQKYRKYRKYPIFSMFSKISRYFPYLALLPFHWLQITWPWMTLDGYFALNSVLRRYVWSCEAWLSMFDYS